MNPKNPPAKNSIAAVPAQTALDLRTEEDFVVRYANHVAITPTGYDAKVTFGRIDPTVGPNVVLQNTAIVLSWPSIKSLIYLLRLSLLGYEAVNGHVPYPQGGLNPPPQTLPKEVLAGIPNSKALQEKVMKLWNDFLTENPEAEVKK